MAEETRWLAKHPSTIARKLRVDVDDVERLLADKDRCPAFRVDDLYHISDIKKALGGVNTSAVKTVVTKRPKSNVPRTIKDVKNLGDARLLVELKKAEMSQLRIDESKGKLIQKSEVERALASLASMAGNVISSAPARHSSSLAATLGVDPHVLRQALDSVFEDVRKDLQPILEGR